MPSVPDGSPRGSGPRPPRTSVTDGAITRIRQMILSGELAPGDKLPPEADLAARLGLSRTSLREAVRALTVLGVVDTRQGDASYITSLGPELLLSALGLAMDLQREDTMADLVAVRRVLEPAATALAATRISAAELQHVRGLLRTRPGGKPGEEQVRADVERDREFHHVITGACGNPLLVALLDGLSAPTMRMRTWRGLSVPGVLERTAAEHEAIVAALESGDAELARAAATVHVAGVETWVRTLPAGWSAAAEPLSHGTPDGVRSRSRPPPVPEVPMTTDPTTPPADPDIWADLARPLPAWLPQAKLGIFIHWGAYSVPAWAEPSGALGAVPEEEWFAHNAYAEWYANTIRIPGSPAAEHHRETYGDAPYDDFLDAWSAERFDPHAWAALFAEAGAQYVVPTTKHHDGVALWDAPGTGTRNTVHRGPRRDLVGDLAEAVRAAGLRFGVYYSGGLDWSISSFGPQTTGAEVGGLRPRDAAYNCYALLHVRDLVARYSPDVLWNDIEWPDSGKRTGAWSLHELFTDFYAGNPDGVVNDRWGETHWDYRTSEYEVGTEAEAGSDWEQCRGLGFSFGYNQVEDTSVVLSGHELARLLADIVSRGGRLLLNVGPTAAGEIPDIQQESLRALGRWMAPMAETIRASTRVDPAVATPGDEPWVRWLATPEHLVALVDQVGSTGLTLAASAADLDRAELFCGSGSVQRSEAGLTVSVDALADGPAAVRIPW